MWFGHFLSSHPPPPPPIIGKCTIARQNLLVHCLSGRYNSYFEGKPFFCQQDSFSSIPSCYVQLGRRHTPIFPSSHSCYPTHHLQPAIFQGPDVFKEAWNKGVRKVFYSLHEAPGALKGLSNKTITQIKEKYKNAKE